MPDQIGNITIPDIAASGTFPIVADYPFGRSKHPDVVVHQFGSGNAKIEQRFLLGAGPKRFTVRRAFLRDVDRRALRDFWESKYGPYGAFTYNAPNDDGNGTTAYTCRFANEPLSWEMLADHACSLGVTLIEIPASNPTYTLSTTVTRFPPDALKNALLSQVQQMIPLIKVQPLQSGYPAIYLSDRRCTIGTQLYLPRLVDFDGISQGMGNEADDATFTFGNADRVMRDLANDVDLFRATIEFSLYHVGQQIKLDLWKGDIINWQFDSGAEFKVTAADGLYELNLPYPSRKVSRSCWKAFNIGACPYASAGALDLVHFPSADASKCDKGYDTANGCLAHGMKRYYGAVIAEPQGVTIKDNSTGVFGFGRSSITSVSLVADSIYDQVIPEIYTDSEMPVNCKVAAGRDESDFYEALGIVGEGPLISYTAAHYEDLNGNPVAMGSTGAVFVGSTLDGQAQHGWPSNEVAGIVGLWADLDLKSDAHPKAALPATIEDAIKILPEQLPPTFVVRTGNGAHAWWLFREPMIFGTDEERCDTGNLALRWQSLLRLNAAAHGWAFDRLADLARVLRVPGTQNCKNPASPKPVEIYCQTDRRYNPSDFAEYLEDQEIPDAETQERAAQAWKVKFADKPLAVDPSAAVSDELLGRYMDTDPRFKKTWLRQREDLQDQSQSGYDLALANFGFEKGLSEE